MYWLMFFIFILYFLSAIGYITYFFLQKDFLQKLGYMLFLTGFIIHSFYIGYLAFIIGYLPVYSLKDTLSIATWSIVGVFLLLRYRFKIKILGVYAAPLVVIITSIILFLPADTVKVQKVFNNFWLAMHVITIFAGEAALTLACGVGIFYLIQERAIKAKKQGFFFKRLPSLNLIDTTSYGCIIIGFSLLTFGLIVGIVYAKIVWGKFWSWDPKEIWAAVTWLIYAALLHGRLISGWRGRKAAYMAVIGFAVLVFTFFGVNFLMQGHHGAFTK